MTENKGNADLDGRMLKKVSRDALLAALPSDRSLSASDDPWYVLELCRHAIQVELDKCEPVTVKLPEEWDVGETGPQLVMDCDEVREALKIAGIEPA